ncbi:MAG TPA: rRNA maturation RNase YbeY [Gammaproteobacteria bacterium]|nr:rRNA maturation RNase YbeY [Gammaproteobacteria bacterium]
MSDASLAVEVQDASGGARMPPADKLREWAKLALGAEARGELTIRIVSKRESAELNARYRGKRGPTNVLAFLADAPQASKVEVKDAPPSAPADAAPNASPDAVASTPPDAAQTAPSGAPQNELLPLGDLVICAPVLAREASEQGKPLEAHWAHIVIHGTLHLQGYDHETAEQAAIMEGRERELLAGLGFRDPYAA